MEPGLCNSSLNPKVCSSLRCIDCDKKVQRFCNARWKPEVDALFMRNYVTNIVYLRSMLEPEWDTCSYTCQCKFVSVSANDSDICETMKWVCGGH